MCKCECGYSKYSYCLEAVLQVIVSDVYTHNASNGSSQLGGFYSYLMCKSECGYSNYNLLFGNYYASNSFGCVDS